MQMRGAARLRDGLNCVVLYLRLKDVLAAPIADAPNRDVVRRTEAEVVDTDDEPVAAPAGGAFGMRAGRLARVERSRPTLFLATGRAGALEMGDAGRD